PSPNPLPVGEGFIDMSKRPIPIRRPSPTAPSPTQNQDRRADLKVRVHQTLLNILNMAAVQAESRHELRRDVQTALERILREDHLPISMTERNRLAEEILDDVFGRGQLVT